MRRSIGLLAERYSKWERRAALTPSHTQRLVQAGIDVLVQPSTSRVYADSEYAKAGATLTPDLSAATAIFGVKQPENGTLLPGKTYLVFSHVIKAQQENMALLDEMLEKEVRLIDYECVREGGGGSMPRLIAFGAFAGKAGVISGIRGLGLRLLSLGYSTPFLSVGPAYSYLDYADAKRALGAVGAQIAERGLPPAVSPLVVTVCGRGNVSRGALDALGALGEETVRWVGPDELPALSALQGTEGEHQRHVYACLLGTEHYVERLEQKAGADGAAAPFDRAHYQENPHEYAPVFHSRIAPHTSMLVTTMYWDRRFPRLLSLDQLEGLGATGARRLLAVADITCDVNGAVESLVRSSSIDSPFYVYDEVARRESEKGLDGSGVLMMGVDILPSELPREASEHFGDALLPFVDTLATPGAPLPPELAAATITEAGALAPSYAYIAAMREARERQAEHELAPAAAGDAEARAPLSLSEARALTGSTVLSMHGHLFDSGLINAALDVVEQAGGRFDLLEINVRPNPTDTVDQLSLRTKSSALLQLTLDDGRPALEGVLARLHELLRRMPLAEASFSELPDYCSGKYDRTLRADDAPAAVMPPTAGAAVPTGAAARAGAAVGGGGVRVASAGRQLLVLGAGMCAGPAVELLCREPADTVHVVSAVRGEAEALCAAVAAAGGRGNCVPHALDVSSGSAEWPHLAAMLSDADAALSLLPASMHAPVAAECIRARTPLVTASYVAPELAALHDEAVGAGVPLLCEMGLDPGLDHMSAAALIARVHAEGGRVASFSSVCGGLPAPECAFNGNPFGYKFSWSPAGVLAATRNAAQWRQGGRVVRVDGAALLHAAEPLGGGLLGRAFSLEVLPNRDALPYASLYGIDDEASSFFRGTLRYAGWCELMAGIAAFGLTAPTPAPAGTATWPELLRTLGVPQAAAGGADAAEARAVAALHWLGAWDEGRPTVGVTVADAFCGLLAERLGYASGERDAVLMEHTLAVEYGGGRAPEMLSSSLVGFGEPDGPSAMAKSVGLTAAVGVRRLLAPPSDALPALRGVVKPTEPSVQGLVGACRCGSGTAGPSQPRGLIQLAPGAFLHLRGTAA